MTMRALLLCLLLGQLAGCAVNPATGRTDFVMMSEQRELELGRRYNQEPPPPRRPASRTPRSSARTT